MRARPARGYAARIDLWIAAAQPSVALTPTRARALAAQPAAESAGLGLGLSFVALQARDKTLEQVELRDDGRAEALREMDQRGQSVDWSRRFDVFARLQHAGETLLQSTRTEMAKPSPAVSVARTGA